MILVPGEGKQLVRLLAALLLSICMLLFGALAMPFQQSHHNYLSIAANLALTCIYCGALIIRLHHQISNKLGASGVEDITWEDLTGFASAGIIATLMLAFLACVVLLLALLLVKQLSQERSLPTIRDDWTGREPELTLKEGQHFHLFLSHTWSTAQV